MTTAKTPGKSKHRSTIRDEHGNKLCRKCDQWLDVGQFPREPRSADGLHSYCTWCMNLAKFGLTRNTYEALLAAQGGACAICDRPQWGNGNKYAVDHDHACCPGVKSCGKCVRGLLCNSCNSALGMMDDQPERLRKAAAYLEGAAHA